jgi:hypothetical protein
MEINGFTVARYNENSSNVWHIWNLGGRSCRDKASAEKHCLTTLGHDFWMSKGVFVFSFSNSRKIASQYQRHAWFSSLNIHFPKSLRMITPYFRTSDKEEYAEGWRDWIGLLFHLIWRKNMYFANRAAELILNALQAADTMASGGKTVE